MPEIISRVDIPSHAENECSVAASPTIAVVIAARDAEAHLGMALDSILAQSSPPEEVVVFDDGSTDETRRIAESYRSRFPNLLILSSEKPIGISASRNRANEKVRSEFISVLDADDLLDQEALRRYRGALAEKPELDLLYGDTSVFSSSPSRGTPLHYPKIRSSKNGIRRVLVSPRIPMKHSSVLYRKRTFEKVGGYDETYRIKVDVELFLRFLKRESTVEKLDAVTSHHRRHRNQISTRRLTGLRTYFRLTEHYETNPFLQFALLASRSFSECAKLLLRR